MKFLVAATAPDLDAKIHKRFGGADYYIVIDPDTQKYSAIQGKGEDEPTHGISQFVGLDIGTVIVGNIGPAAFRDSVKMGWSVYSCHGMTVREAIEKVQSGQISPLKAPTMKRSVRRGRNHQTGHST